MKDESLEDIQYKQYVPGQAAPQEKKKIEIVSQKRSGSIQPKALQQKVELPKAKINKPVGIPKANK